MSKINKTISSGAERVIGFNLLSIIGALPALTATPQDDPPEQRIRGVHSALLGEFGFAVVHPKKPHGLGAIEVNIEYGELGVSLVIMLHREDNPKLFDALEDRIKNGA